MRTQLEYDYELGWVALETAVGVELARIGEGTLIATGGQR
jgi:hypothetical protein